jgi:hypothetical protein
MSAVDRGRPGVRQVWRLSLWSSALLLASGLAASAQFADIFRPTGLTGQDIELARQAAQRFFDGRTPQLGDTAEWQNPSSGASGTARIVQVNSEGTCVVLRHRFKPNPDAAEGEVSLKRCRSGEGTWDLSD